MPHLLLKLSLTASLPTGARARVFRDFRPSLSSSSRVSRRARTFHGMRRIARTRARVHAHRVF
jgi:hypothetical protein